MFGLQGDWTNLIVGESRILENLRASLSSVSVGISRIRGSIESGGFNQFQVFGSTVENIDLAGPGVSQVVAFGSTLLSHARRALEEHARAAGNTGNQGNGIGAASNDPARPPRSRAR